MKERRTWLYALCKFLAPAVLGIPYGYHIVQGKNNIPEDGRFIVCSNHISLLDPFWMAMAQKRQIYFMAKEELFVNPALKWGIKQFGGFAVKRGAVDKTAINKAFDILKRNKIIGIFPEGTRSKDGELLKGKAGAAMIAYNEQSPIVPVAIYAKEGKVKVFGKVFVAFGEPLSLEELGLFEGNGKELRNATRIIMEKITQLREECIKYSEK